MIKLRLRRMGAKKRPSYRIVATDSRSPRDGRFIEAFGFYDPLTQPATVRVDFERARHWLGVGAQPSDTVRDIFRRAGVLGGESAANGAVAAAAASAEPPVTEPAAAEETAPKRRRRTTAEPTAAEPAAPTGAEPATADEPTPQRRRRAAATPA